MPRWIVLALALVACAPDAADAPDAGGDASTFDRGDTGLVDAGTADGGAAPDGGPPPGQVTLGGDRPAQMVVPEGYDGSPRPLVILLHGYSIDAAAQDAYFQMSARVDERGFFLLLPNGTPEASAAGYRFWNATDACCNFYGSTVDDVAYLRGLIDEAKMSFAIGSVHLIGHSNGGFMAYRMACDAADAIDSVVSLAGATFLDDTRCRPTRPTRVLQIHGTSDTTILYAGVATGPMQYPGAEDTVRRWAAHDGCDPTTIDNGAPLDLDLTLTGTETDVMVYERGCAPGVDAELWRINGAGHIPTLTPDFTDRMLDWTLPPE